MATKRQLGTSTRSIRPGPPLRKERLPETDARVSGNGSYYLSKQQYEWGVHIAVFAEKVGLTDDQVRSLTFGSPDDACWVATDRLSIELVDELHDTSTISDDLWARLAEEFTTAQLLDMMLLAGWYHAISYVARAAEVPLEDFAARFTDVR